MTEETIFTEALQKPDPAGRSAYLDATCGGDAALRRRVEALLAAHEAGGSFLEPPFDAVAAIAGGWVAPPGAAGSDPAPDERLAVTSPDPAAGHGHGSGPMETETRDTLAGPALSEPGTEGPGAIIGPYRLLHQIGEGGMGTVYLAEQERPVRRQVALKVIKAGMDTRQVVARFEAERQALALMDHVHIARVLDAGATDSGRPYFVMELVHGVPITSYCDANQLTPRQRLELFVPVCRAIQHAHQKGIIHRDIKPSNVLVTLHDGVPVPKVIDFGVAKATEQTQTERSLFTQHGTLVGTLEYMSPEQAEMGALGVDTRSDVYSLGVLLYELLTGGTPLGRERVREAAYAEVLRMIKEDEPPRPSTRLSDSGEALASISALRQTESVKLTKLVRGELDWIVMRSLEKDRNRRYGTASGFAMDVQRYLNDELVEACPPSGWYRLRKLARRNRRALAAAAVLGVALLVAMSALTVSYVRIDEALAHETQARKDREQALESEQQANEKLERTSYFRSIALAERQLSVGNVGRAEELLNESLPRLRGWEWHFLKRQRYGSAAPLPHQDTVLRVEFSPDGRHIATGSLDGTLRIWDAQAGRVLYTLPCESPHIRALAYSRDGLRLAVAHNDGRIRVWEAATGKPLVTLAGHDQPVSQVAFSPDGRTLATASRDRTVRLWDVGATPEVDPNRLIRTLSDHPADVKAVAFSPTGDRLLAACLDGTVTTWHVAGGNKIASFRGQVQAVQNASFSPDARSLAWSSMDGVVAVWDTAAGREKFSVQSNTHLGRFVAFSPDGQRIALAGFDGTLRLLDGSTGRETLTIYAHPSLVAGVSFSPDGGRLASASYDQTVRIWDATPLAGDPLAPRCVTVAGHTEQVYGVAFSPDGRLLASASVDGTVKVWQLLGNREPGSAGPGPMALRHTLRRRRGDTANLAFSPDGTTLASGGSDGVVILWDLDAPVGDSLKERGTIRLNGLALSLGFSPDGRLLAVGQPGGIALYDPATRAEAHPFKRTMTPVPALEFTPEGRHLISAGATDPVVKVWAVAEPTPSFEIRHASNPNAAIAVSRDGRFIASPGRDRTVIIWDVDWDAKTYAEVRTLKGHAGYVWRVAFSPDGRYLASGSWDSTIKVWDLKASESAEPVTLRGHAGFIRSLAFSPDGRHLASASGYAGRGEVKVWDATLWGNKSSRGR